MTRAQRAVLGALSDTDRFVSAQDLHAVLRGRGESVGLSSVYRALHELERGGQVDVVRSDEGESTYRACDAEEHHHHLICIDCGATVEIEASEMERWVARTAAQHGFVLDRHTLELHGRCAACAHRAGRG